MSDPLVDALTRSLQDAQRMLASERARNEQLVARLHYADQREAQYQELIEEQQRWHELLEGHYRKKGAA